MATVVICDDDADRVFEWANRVRDAIGQSSLDVLPLEPKDFALAFRALKSRKAALSRGDVVTGSDDASVLDDAALLLVDFDLTPTVLEEPGDDGVTREVLTGEFGDTFAYLARCYTRADFTVVVNHLARQKTFDLTMTAQLKSTANLAISEEELDAPELWTGVGDGYKPSHWPRLAEAAGRISRLSEELDLDAPVLSFLGLEGIHASDGFAQEHMDALGDNPTATTFRGFATGSDQFGLIGRNDRQNDEGILARIAVAGVCCWLEKVVLPSQSALVDAQHLLARFPGLAEGDWSAAADRTREAELLNGPLQVFDAARVHLDGWLGRAVWSWPDAAQIDPAVDEVVGDGRVFAEDVSSFVTVEEASEFTAAVAGPYKQRFIRRLPKVEYLPRNRLYV